MPYDCFAHEHGEYAGGEQRQSEMGFFGAEGAKEVIMGLGIMGFDEWSGRGLNNLELGNGGLSGGLSGGFTCYYLVVW